MRAKGSAVPWKAPPIMPPTSRIRSRILPATMQRLFPNLPDEAGRKVSEQSERFARQAQSTMQSTMARVLRDQPLVVAAVGLAAGAAVAAAFPATDVENRTLGGARDALTDAASKVGENVMQAASKAGERLKSAAQERGLTPDGLKELAGEVADTFADGVSGKSGERRSPDREGQPFSGLQRHRARQERVRQRPGAG